VSIVTKLLWGSPAAGGVYTSSVEAAAPTAAGATQGLAGDSPSVLFPCFETPCGPAFAGMFSSAGRRVIGRGNGRRSGRGERRCAEGPRRAWQARARWCHHHASAGMFTALTIGDRNGGAQGAEQSDDPDANQISKQCSARLQDARTAGS
jgi:hypothetical protein